MLFQVFLFHLIIYIMDINFKTSNLELTPDIRAYVWDKMAMVEKFLGKTPVIACDFEVEQTNHHHLKGEIFRAEVNLAVPGRLLRVEKTEKNLFKAIDKVKDHLARVIKKYKEKK